MSTRRQRQILRNRKLEFLRTMEENERKAKQIVKKNMAEKKAEEQPKKEETKIVRKKTTKKEDK